MVDAVELAQELIRCPSVTPKDAGALNVLQAALEELGFACYRLPFSENGTPDVANMYARRGDKGPNFCFAGHTDVVPLGNTDAWSVDPFGGEIIDGILYGRGATDMKSAIAAFVEAVSRILVKGDVAGSISLLITGDEEGPAINGTKKVLDWMEKQGELIDVCLVGEPTNPNNLGDMVKIGRRGSLTGHLKVTGVQGHAAYPHLADNPLPRLVKMLDALSSHELDQGTDHFQPSSLQLTTVDTGNPATNVIPAQATASFNIRFNDLHTSEELTKWLHTQCDAVGGQYDLDIRVSGEAFLTPPGDFSALITSSVEKATGVTPELSTSGGTSDARFIKNFCPVAEFGLISQTMHKVDERIAVSDIRTLTDIYTSILAGYFTDIAAT
ncbi:MAG: succinyl-diaminopimelate desuccinylase [Pseudomonadota bacterium]|nr:succinyl-diaminopimelate desuccinylase [Pseudomonadota bacterium]MEC8086257.1 succinyl-diaminopimelate desuccinylase [Pseudomonadota bacterium]MEC8288561.1 succinyl-diaminopimelate desuccinylase [Pseudomonadota bacterium]